MTTALLDALPNIPRDKDGPVFREPWEAQAFAMTVALHAKGLFTWAEWADALAYHIKTTETKSACDSGVDYYSQWLSALEQLVIAKHAATPEGLHTLQAAWDRAARATPHGQPIELANDPSPAYTIS